MSKSALSFPTVETSLTIISKSFDEVTDRRERLIKESREAISLASKSIVAIHTGNFGEAAKLRTQAERKLDELRKVASTDLARYLTVPEQEYVESSVVYSISAKKKIPTLSELKVSPTSYVLGLLDAIGELKRAVYDNIRRGNPKDAEAIFGAMESLYLLISPFAVYDNIAPGTRRKLDIARALIEDTRTTITEEIRRTEFISAVNKLAGQLGSPPLLQRSSEKLLRKQDSQRAKQNRRDEDRELSEEGEREEES